MEGAEREQRSDYPHYWQLKYVVNGEEGKLDELLSGRSIRSAPDGATELVVTEHTMRVGAGGLLADARQPLIRVPLTLKVDGGLAPDSLWKPVFYRKRGMDQSTQVGGKRSIYNRNDGRVGLALTVFGRARESDQSEMGDVTLWALWPGQREAISCPAWAVDMGAIHLALRERETGKLKGSI